MEEQSQSPEKANKLPKWLITVTPFSKYLAMVLFIVLPFVGFYLGMKYQEKVTIMSQVVSEFQKITIPSPTVTQVDIASWKTYINKNYGFSFKYPQNYFIKDDSSKSSPLALSIQDRSNLISGGGVQQDFYLFFYVSAIKTNLNPTDYVNDPTNGLTYLSSNNISDNKFTIVKETHGAPCGAGNQYLIKSGDYIIDITNPLCYKIDLNTFNQVLGSFKLEK